MAIITPKVFTPCHIEETDYMSPNDEEILRKLIRNSNFLLDLAPVGKIIFVNPNQPGAAQPNSAYWQICDGSEIKNPNSPLRSIGINLRYTPDLKNKYPCGAPNPNENNSGGSQEHNFIHSHTTGVASAVGSGLRVKKYFWQRGNRDRANTPHTHVLFEQFNEPTIVDSPAYVYLIGYMKIV